MLKILFTKLQNYKIKNSHILYARAGQSLAEVLIGLSIGAILIGAASFAITTALKANLSSQRSQFAANLAQELIERSRGYSSADWQNIYGLTKGSSTPYFFVATGTQFFATQGIEGVTENDIRTGLVGEWNLDEATGTITYSSVGSNINGTLTNNPIRATSTCKLGSCINFSGAGDHVDVPDSTAFDLDQNGFTYAAWIKPSSFPNDHNMIMGHYLPYFNVRSTGKLFMSLRAEGSQRTVTGNTVLSVSTWYHVVATYDSTGYLKVYLNGALDGTTGPYLTPGNFNSHFYIGKWTSDSSGPFSGVIDDVRVYNRALSADEIKQLYNSNIYSRSFYVENTCRTTDASSTYSGVAPCGGGSIDDPSSQKIIAVVTWGTGLGFGQVALSDMLTRWKNAIFQQSDWSGGSSGNVLINSGTTFASSSNVNYGGGSIRINGL